MKTLRESIFDEDSNLEKVEKDAYIRQISNVWNNVKSSQNLFKDRFGRDLNIGDLVYHMSCPDLGIITNFNNPANDSYNIIDCSVKSIDGIHELDAESPHLLILIPKSCYKDLLKILKTKK